MNPYTRLESAYPVLALHCHELVEASQVYLLSAASRIAKLSAELPVPHNHTTTVSDYYAKLHTVAELPLIFLSITGTVWCATDDVARGLWAIDVVETALGCALDPVAQAAVEAGIAADRGSIDITACKQPVIDGVRLFAAVVFDTALALTER